MKTEDLLRYEAMYVAMRRALSTPWLIFEFLPQRPLGGADRSAQPADLAEQPDTSSGDNESLPAGKGDLSQR